MKIQIDDKKPKEKEKDKSDTAQESVDNNTGGLKEAGEQDAVEAEENKGPQSNNTGNLVETGEKKGTEEEEVKSSVDTVIQSKEDQEAEMKAPDPETSSKYGGTVLNSDQLGNPKADAPTEIKSMEICNYPLDAEVIDYSAFDLQLEELNSLLAMVDVASPLTAVLGKWNCKITCYTSVDKGMRLFPITFSLHSLEENVLKFSVTSNTYCGTDMKWSRTCMPTKEPGTLEISIV